MIVKECMTKKVDLATPAMTLKDAALKMRAGDYGVLPVADNDRLVGMVTDRDIAIRGIAEGTGPESTLSEIMSTQVLYCYEDQTMEEVARNMGDNQVRRLPVLSREKRLVGILSLGDFAKEASVGEALEQISTHDHREPRTWLNA